MKVKVSRAAVAVSVVAALGFTAACGGGDEKEEPGRSAAASTPGADGSKGAGETEEKAPLTAAQLDEAVLASGDVAGYRVEEMSEEDMPAGSLPIEPAACQSIADMFFFTSTTPAESRTGRTFTPESDADATVTSLALLAHEQGDAEKVIAGLRTASEKCTEYEQADYRYTGVEALPAPEHGDEAVAYRLTGDIEDTTVPMAFTIVRSGSTLAAFYAMNVLDADKAEVPPEVIEKQLEKLEKLEKLEGTGA
ncbi:hypothetical protein [Streptomyces sp. CRN 30]|uniref:hypothetical protein n=1 Tax=Streptomyces sp. CRN 30 TaxID=3075613 RepID=UPI002A7F1980|nr:hypothetical protein [Streptomyces sp. CRN 30]